MAWVTLGEQSRVISRECRSAAKLLENGWAIGWGFVTVALDLPHRQCGRRANQSRTSGRHSGGWLRRGASRPKNSEASHLAFLSQTSTSIAFQHRAAALESALAGVRGRGGSGRRACLRCIYPCGGGCKWAGPHDSNVGPLESSPSLCPFVECRNRTLDVVCAVFLQ